MLKTVFNILLGTSEWRLADTGKRSIHHYYESDKTGDRKVVTQKHPPQKRRKQMRPGYGYQPLDLVWLQSGSGKYYIDHEYVDTVKNPERRVSDKPPVPPKGPAGTARRAP